MTFYI